MPGNVWRTIGRKLTWGSSAIHRLPNTAETVDGRSTVMTWLFVERTQGATPGTGLHVSRGIPGSGRPGGGGRGGAGGRGTNGNDGDDQGTPTPTPTPPPTPPPAPPPTPPPDSPPDRHLDTCQGFGETFPNTFKNRVNDTFWGTNDRVPGSPDSIRGGLFGHSHWRFGGDITNPRCAQLGQVGRGLLTAARAPSFAAAANVAET